MPPKGSKRRRNVQCSKATESKKSKCHDGAIFNPTYNSQPVTSLSIFESSHTEQTHTGLSYDIIYSLPTDEDNDACFSYVNKNSNNKDCVN